MIIAIDLAHYKGQLGGHFLDTQIRVANHHEQHLDSNDSSSESSLYHYSHLKVIPESSLVSFTETTYPYAQWKKAIDDFSILNITSNTNSANNNNNGNNNNVEEVKHIIICAGRAPLGMLMYAGSKLPAQDIFRQGAVVVDVLNEISSENKIVPWRVSSDNHTTPNTNMFVSSQVFPTSDMNQKENAKYLVICITLFQKFSEANSQAVRKALNDPNALIYTISPDHENQQKQKDDQTSGLGINVTAENFMDILHCIREKIYNVHNQDGIKDKYKIAMAFAGPAPLAFLIGQTVQSRNVFGDITFLDYRRPNYEICAE